MGIATRERHIIYYTEGLCHMSRDAALRRFHASGRSRAECLSHLGAILVFLGKWSRRGHRGCLSRLGTILVFLDKWNRRGEAKRFLCPATAMAHSGRRRRWRRGSLSSGIGNACDSHPRPAAAKALQLCPQKRSAVHVPMQCIAFAIAARCIRHRSALRFSFRRGRGELGCAFRPGPEAASSLLGMHSDELGTRLRWGMARGKRFQQSYRKIPQKAVLWQQKWAGWLDLSQNLDKFAMIIAKKQKHEGKTFPRCAAQRSVSQATEHIPQTTKASGPEEVQQGREFPYELQVINQ